MSIEKAMKLLKAYASETVPAVKNAANVEVVIAAEEDTQATLSKALECGDVASVGDPTEKAAVMAPVESGVPKEDDATDPSVQNPSKMSTGAPKRKRNA